jgi:hypothetical protein
MAKALHIKYCREHNKDTWKSIYEQEDDFSSLAAVSIREAYEPKVTAKNLINLIISMPFNHL